MKCPCFLDFKKDELIHMWIAQGFIQPQQEKENLRMEDIGEDYFNFLLSRSLFQDVIKDENERIVGFKMHDLIHEIACVASNPQKTKLSNPNNGSGKSARKVRTLIGNKENIDYLVSDDDLVSMRVLKLNWHWDGDLWILMDKLIHLRYLDISKFDYSIDRAQKSLCLLYNLQTLKLGYSVLPKNLRKLVNLRHLEFMDYGMKQMPSHMGNLIHLQTLSEFVVGFEKGCKIEELGPLKNLKGTITLINLQEVQNEVEAMAAELKEKENLRKVIFRWSVNREGGEYESNSVEVLKGLQPPKNLRSLEIDNFRGEVLPNNIFVEDLVEICLDDCGRCEKLPKLGQLPNLKKLEIKSLNNVRSIGNEFYGIDSNQRNSFAFPQLKVLYISGMKKLEQWDEPTDVIASNLFGCLKKLAILDCDQLAKLPSGLESCHSIEYLTIFNCPNLILNVQNLPNLHYLRVHLTKRTLLEGLSEHTKLEKMEISGCSQDFEFIPFIHLSSQLLELMLIDDRTSDNVATQLPQQLQHLINLKVLSISGFLALKLCQNGWET